MEQRQRVRPEVVGPQGNRGFDLFATDHGRRLGHPERFAIILRRSVDGLIAWLRELGLRHVEVSDGTIALDATVKRELITRLAGEFIVLAEVGSKDADFIMAPYVWVEQIERDLEAGAWKVVAEARESGTAGIYRADGEVRSGLIDEIAHAVNPERMIFEAPLKAQQVWLLDFFGSECNLGNIAPNDVLSLETLRLGLRSDTVERFALDGKD